jgi:hypothetical protein
MDRADPSTATQDERREAEGAARKESFACLMLSGADNKRYARIETDLENKMTFGTDSYPRTRDETMTLLNNYHVGINVLKVQGNSREQTERGTGIRPRRRRTSRKEDEQRRTVGMFPLWQRRSLGI